MRIAGVRLAIYSLGIDRFLHTKRSKIPAQEFGHHRQAFPVVERSAAVSGARDDFKLDGCVHFFVSAPKFKGLVDRHLLVLIAVQ